MVCASWQHAMNSALRCVCRSDWTQKCPVNPKPADLTQVLVSIKLFSRDHACQCNAEGSVSEPGISVPQPLAAEGVSNPDSHHAFSGSFTDGARESDFGCQFRRFGPHYISEGETFVSFWAGFSVSCLYCRTIMYFCEFPLNGGLILRAICDPQQLQSQQSERGSFLVYNSILQLIIESQRYNIHQMRN